ncbi:unnamed protein product [Taenia asiatica]|uniref:Cadherin domain-containing protein n=1 Tax=Taenia asiatica TaxID=60517 RepID=A0A0R3W337_TAEAS|nr:unnamed protein product [Taenia asiatica]
MISIKTVNSCLQLIRQSHVCSYLGGFEMLSQAFVQLILAIFPLLVKTSKSPPNFLTVDIFEEQPVGSHVVDVAQELGLSVDKSSTSGAVDTASYFKIVVANSAINDYFSISSTNGRISLKKHLDRDTLCQNERLCCESEDDRGPTPIPLPDGSYFRRTAISCKLSFRVVYRLNANGSAMHESRMAFCSVDVNIHDLNDCAPRFLLKDKNTEIDTCFDLPMAFDEDSPRFTANAMDILQLRQKLDREAIEEYNLDLVVSDASLSITVIVGDVNDHAPEVEASVEVRLKEDTPVGTRVTQIVAHDKDAGDNAKIRYEIRSLAPSQLSRFPFAIDSTTGVAHGLVEFLVISSDNGQDISFSSTTTVSVQIEDVNDEAPVIKTVDLASRSNPPRPTGTLVAFVTELQLVTKMALDRELAPMQPVTIICVDHAHPVAFAKTGFQRVLVSVTDENDNDPIFPNDVIELSVHENNPPGELLYRLNATDADEMVAWISGLRTPLIYEIDSKGKPFFSLDPSSGNLYTKESFDREKQEIIEFGVVARDHGTPQRSASAKVVVRILDRNDHAPEFDQKVYNVSVLESTSLGEVVLKVSAHDKDQGLNSEFSYHLEDLRVSLQGFIFA